METSPKRRRFRISRILLGAYVVLCLAALVWPGYELVGNRVEPYVLGLPFAFAWHIGWVILTCLVIALFHLANRGGDGE